MKFRTSLLLAALACSPAPAEDYGVPYYSVGDISADASNLTPTGSQPLDWKIQHPSTISSFVSFDPTTGALSTLKDVRVTMHVVGVGTEGYLHHSNVALFASLNGSSWLSLFSGSPLDQSARTAVFEQNLAANTSIQLSGRRLGETGAWLSARTSTTGAGTFVVGLKKGDEAPTAVINAPQPATAAYLSPEAGDSTVQVGPMQMLFCFELNAEGEGEANYNLQDLVVLVSFEAL